VLAETDIFARVLGALGFAVALGGLMYGKRKR
jgi:LPXTG-motif cell wall-anchored protein